MKALIKKLNLILTLTAALVAAQVGSAAELTTMRLSRAVDSISTLPFAIAQDKGMFEKNGLKVETIDFKGGAPAVQALVSGSVDACLCAGDHVVNLTTRGFPAQILIGLSDKHGYSLMGPANSPLTDLKSLKGKRIGVTSAGSQTDNTIRYDLKEKGMNPDTDVQIISIGGGGPMQAAIKSGAVDAGMFTPPFTEQNIRGGMKMIVDYRVYNYPSFTVLALNKWVKANAETAKKFVKAVREAQDAMKADRKLAVESARKLFPNMDSVLLNEVVDNFISHNAPPRGVVDPKGFKLMNDMVKMADPSINAVSYKDGVAVDILK